MTKLINAYRANPTLANREKLQAYIKRHPMAIVLCTQDEMAFIRDNHFSY